MLAADRGCDICMGWSAAADPNCSEAAAPWLLRSTADSAALTFVLAGFCFLLGFASELLHALAHRGRAEASCSSIRAAAAPLAQLPVAPLAQLPAAAPPPLRPCAATERSAATKPAAGGTAAVKALRAAGEAAWGGRLPVALDDDVYLAALVAKQARDHAADEGYARRKLTAAVRWRMEMAYVAGGEAGAGEAAAASRGGEEFAAAPVATHALVCGVPRVAALLRGDRPEPCAAPNQRRREAQTQDQSQLSRRISSCTVPSTREGSAACPVLGRGAWPAAHGLRIGRAGCSATRRCGRPGACRALQPFH